MEVQRQQVYEVGEHQQPNKVSERQQFDEKEIYCQFFW